MSANEELTVQEFCQKMDFLRDPSIIYIQKHSLELDCRQQKDLLRYIIQFTTSAVKTCGDGSRINLDTLPLDLLRKIESFVRNQIEYTAFFSLRLGT